jgi:outer membrane protein assembly complex protein YaeT
LAAAVFLVLGGIPARGQSADSAALAAVPAASTNGGQTPAKAAEAKPGEAPTGEGRAGGDRAGEPGPDILAQWQGLPVKSISFEGVTTTRLDPLPGHLAQTVGAPLNPENLRESLRQLFATGLYETIEVAASRADDGVALVFTGTARTFIGNVGVDGATGATINAQLDRATQLSPGTRFTPAKLARALREMRSTLADNGFHEPKISQALTPHPDEQLVDIAFRVVSGPQARIGSVEVTGEPGMSVAEFRHYARLRTGARVDHDTANRALAGVLKHYRNQERLEAEIKLESQQYDPATKRTNFRFTVTEGPRVKVQVLGVNLTQERVRRVIPIYEEGTVDEDLLNEGNRRLRDYYQRLGYFDVKVDHVQQFTGPNAAGANSAGSGTNQVQIVFNVALGPRRRVQRVEVAGNHYFDSATLRDMLSVHAADALDHQGAYSQALVSADVSVLETVYRNNGFSKARVTPETSTPETSVADKSAVETPQPGSARAASEAGKTAPLVVTYRIDEGQQIRVGTVQIEGADHGDKAQLTSLLNTTPGQLLSPRNLAGDRDALVTDYLSRGFEHPQVDVTEQADPAGPARVNVVFHITEGPQVFVRKVLLTGLHFTRQDTVERAITIHPGDPLNQTALLDTQRNLYEFALFNEVNTAVENPSGGDMRKTVLLQAVEARRWALTYGFGFEAQTGTPHYNCGLIIVSGAPCNTTGKTGVSPRVLADITRNNLFGREQSASLQVTYGLLEQKIDLIFQVPHLHADRNFGFNLSGGYANSLDVTTYVASKLEGGLRWTQHFNPPQSLLSKANTFVYDFNFRRVKVQANSLQVAPTEIALLSKAVRVGGPAVTWIRDTRDSPLDAHRGTYTSFQEFLSNKVFGAQAVFNRVDVSNSSYWSFDKKQFVLARNTRYGQERAFGTPGTELIPLPERLYAGGATSLRGFSVNAAGPRDPETGYPTGGAGALINSTEMRLPPSTLPFFGNALSLVVFHDMGNIFSNASEAWPSALRVRQPDRDMCKNPMVLPPGTASNSTGLIGPCSFNYFSHALGTGLRYHTPAGPIRLDFSYNLNPPIFPVVYNYSNSTAPPTVGEASHFNFFFSLGQSF